MASPMQMLISSFLLLLAFLSFTLADTSTMKTSSKDQVACQMCESCDNPCLPPPPPPVVLCSPPPPPPPECPPPPPPTCHQCLSGAVPVQPQPRNPQVGVIGGTVYAQPGTASGTVPYFTYNSMNSAFDSASTSNMYRKLSDACSATSLLLATVLCFF